MFSIHFYRNTVVLFFLEFYNSKYPPAQENGENKSRFEEWELDFRGRKRLGYSMHAHTRTHEIHCTVCADAAERLLTLLGVDEEENEENLVSSSSSSEDEGVELDEELEDEDGSREDSRLLHQLAASLANELKQSRRRQSCTTGLEPHRMEVIVVGTNYPDHSCLQDQSFKGGTSNWREVAATTNKCKRRGVLESRRRLEGRSTTATTTMGQEAVVPSSWNAGWDACAAEALRYLVEDEGLPPHHPTVLAMKDHLEVQRERAFVRYAT